VIGQRVHLSNSSIPGVYSELFIRKIGNRWWKFVRTCTATEVWIDAHPTNDWSDRKSFRFAR
jgi:hypothetical protein